jgi:hypothetical protein
MTKPSVDRIIRDSRDGCLVLSQGEAKVMVDEIVRLRAALVKHAIFQHVRMAEGGGTVPSGYSCEHCDVECGGTLQELRHRSDCPLSFLNHQ